MNKVRAISIGAFVWLFIALAFAGLGNVPLIKDSLDQQALIISILIIPLALFGASIYYKNGSKGNGFTVGLVMVGTALLLDALITVPFVEIPNGGSYQSFYTYPLLWVLVMINLATVYLFWKVKFTKV